MCAAPSPAHRCGHKSLLYLTFGSTTVTRIVTGRDKLNHISTSLEYECWFPATGAILRIQDQGWRGKFISVVVIYSAIKKI